MSNPVDISKPNGGKKHLLQGEQENHNLANTQMKMKGSYQQKRLKIFFKRQS